MVLPLHSSSLTIFKPDYFIVCLFIVLSSFFTTYTLLSQSIIKRYWDYPKEYDYPKNILYGTYDFDEWPGVDHSVVYKTIFPFNQSKYDNFKIDYDLSTFDSDDHEGYLKSPQELKRKGYKDIAGYIDEKLKTESNLTIMGIFAHPDDESLLAGGMFNYLKKRNCYIHLVIISNGAASEHTVPEKEIERKKLLYNAFGVLPNGKFVAKCDLLGVSRIINLKNYAKKYLNIDSVEVLKMNEIVESKLISEFGEISNMDYRLTYGPKTKYRNLLLTRIKEKIKNIQPDIIITHGSNGEYGHYLHIVLNLLVKDAVALSDFKEKISLLTAFPEYNYEDKITHFLDLEQNDVLKNKHSAIKSIPEIYLPGKDFDKPWDPNRYPEGVFMKDYGYSPLDATPPRYEFFKIERY